MEKYNFGSICVDHVIWTGGRILNFEMFIYIFVFCWIKKKDKLLCNIFTEITHPFLYLEGAQNTFHSNIKKAQQQKSFDIRHQFQYSTPCPNDMIHAIVDMLKSIKFAR